MTKTGTNVTQKELRDAIRAATVGAKCDFKTEIVKWEGVSVEVRQMSIATRFELYDASQRTDADGKETFDSLRWTVMLVVINTYVPGTDVRVYDDADFELLSKQPTEGFVDKIAEAAKVLNGLSGKEEEGNSPATTNDS